MRIFGASNEIQRILYESKCGDLYFENEAYFEQFLNLNQEDFILQFQELQYLYALEESEIHDLDCYIRGLRLYLLENRNFCKTIQEVYIEAIHHKKN